MTISNRQVIHSYRHLYRHLLHAVQYSIPARYTARDRIRHAFRTSPLEAYDPQRIERTLEFLHGAAKVRGLEHRILKTLLHVWWEQKRLPVQNTTQFGQPFQKKAYEQFDRTIEMLNESMGLCVK